LTYNIHDFEDNTLKQKLILLMKRLDCYEALYQQFEESRKKKDYYKTILLPEPNSKYSSILQFEPTEIANQLTLIDYQLQYELSLSELVNKNSEKKRIMSNFNKVI